MIDVDRRTMLGGTAAAMLLAAKPAFAMAGEKLPALFIYDQRVPASRLAAEQLAARNVPVLDPRERDLGLAWREEIPRIVVRGGVSIAGITMWSDQFICESFGRDHGLTLKVLRALGADANGANGAQEWVLA